jgi:hypothetical protein
MAYNSEDNEKEIRSNQKEILDLSNQINRSFEKRKDLVGAITDKEREYKSLVSESNRLSQQIADNAEKISKFQIKSRDLANSISKAEKVALDAANKFANIQKDLTRQRISAGIEYNSLKAKEIDLSKQINDATNENRHLENQKHYELSKGRNISLDVLKTIQDQINANRQNIKDNESKLTQVKKDRDIQKEIKKNINSILDDEKKRSNESKTQIDRLKSQLELTREVERATFLTEKSLKTITLLPGINKFFKAGDADKILQIAKQAAASLAEAQNNNIGLGNILGITLGAAGEAFSVFGGNILKASFSLENLLKSAFAASRESTNLSKNLGYGAANADRVRANFAAIERSTSNTNVTTKNLSEAFNELSEATGFVTEYSEDALVTQIKLTKQLGLSGTEAAGIYKSSILTGKSSEETYQSMLRGYVATRNSLRVGVPFRAAMAEASKVTGQLAANMGYNLENTIKGVVATKALGTSLEQAKSQGEKLLDFQSSIESELKAELITGQQLNLERARAAALMGDQVTVAEELAAQGMTAAKFSQMNTIAQRSYAEALGTTSDELANQLMKREQAIASGKSLAQITAEEADEAAKRQDAQTKFNLAVEKIQSILGNLVAGPLGTMLDLLSEAAGVLSAMAVTWTVITGFQKLSAMYEAAKTGYMISQRGAALGYNGILLARQAIMAGELAKAIGIAAAYAVANPLTALAGVAVAGAVAAGLYSMVKADDMVSEGGYGKRTILSPEGAVRLNDNDTIVAGTDLGGGEGESVKSSPSIDLTPMISAINEVTSAVNQLNSKKWDVYLDSKVVGTGLMQKSYKSA